MENPNTNSENIQNIRRNRIWHRKMRHAYNEKWKRQMKEGARLSNQEKIGEKETYKYLGILEVDTIKQVEIKERKLTTKRHTILFKKSWIIDCLKMYKTSDEFLKFIDNTMKNWKLELTDRGKCLSEVKTPRRIFQGDTLSPLLFVMAIMPLSHILRKCTEGYKLHKL